MSIGVHNIAVSEITPEWVNLSLLGRVLAYDWSKEGYIFASIFAFVFLHYFFLRRNQAKVAKWVASHRPVLTKEFYQVGVSPNPKDPLVAPYSPTLYSTYATGRVGIDAVKIEFGLKGRHNPITLSLEYLLDLFFGHKVTDDYVNVTIVPSSTSAAPIHPCVFAVINKEDMKEVREENYYLSITKTSDSPKLPNTFVFMSESAELTDNLFSTELSDAIKNSSAFLKFFALADLQKESPKKLEDLVSHPRVILSFRFPKTEAEYTASSVLLQAAIDFVDSAPAKSFVRPEVAKKIKATRDSETRKIVKALDEAKAEEIAKKKAEEKRNQRNAISKMSPAEQKKYEQRERDKEMRKLRSKNARRI
ncbi:uncharacterized protein SAPINGB_P002572 [Magnusiomyces paraingens]|uniref:DUF1682-domain-containing protein n=1 Tax=Magnusiomyces paraingens TaxID=2606893 RepID=A0A5E8BEL7_9ASCO|nr:uncharacterized protein SAPINGB_P002572 [Saprochaete ingens]VVT50043.1 unnamed protein product [Saprochaete ingens]